MFDKNEYMMIKVVNIHRMKKNKKVTITTGEIPQLTGKSMKNIRLKMNVKRMEIILKNLEKYRRKI